MTLIEKINSNLLQARKDKNIIKKNILSLIKGEYELLSKSKSDISDSDLISIIKKLVKSISNVDNDKSRQELDILSEYLPSPLGEAEILYFISDKDKSLGMKLIPMTIKHFGDRADSKLISQVIKNSILS